MDIHKAQRIFFHGIGGSGMRGLAWILSQHGKEIRGCDAQDMADLPSEYTVAKQELAEPLLEKADIYIYSDAIPSDHPLREKVAAKGITSISFAQALGQFSSQYKTIAVAGTHGKSSTTAFLAHILVSAGVDPTVLVGAAILDWPGKYARIGASDIFLVEADEYLNHFHNLTPEHLIITTIEFDHPDFFKSIEDVVASFQKLIDSIPPDGTVIITKDLQKKALIHAPEKKIHVAKEAAFAPIPGTHMKENAGLAISAAKGFGVDPDAAAASLQTFGGLARRFEVIGTVSGTPIISDYAHHPTEIAATIEAARQSFPDASIALIFEAHTSDRLITFQKDFAHVLQEADEVMFYPPFIARGRQTQETEEALTALVNTVASTALTSRISDTVNLPGELRKLALAHDIVIACTAGRLDQDLRKIVKTA